MPKKPKRRTKTMPTKSKPAKRPAAAAKRAPVKPGAPLLPPPPKGKPGRKRGRRRGLLSGLGHEHERDILDQYLHEVSKTPLLTQKEEIALARKVRAGDQECMQELVKRNLRFVISVAKKYQNRGPPPASSILIRASSSSPTRCGGSGRRSWRRWRVRAARCASP